MAEASDGPSGPGAPETASTGGDAARTEVELPAHPKGTLVILLIYGALFAIGWAWIYFGEFLARGAPTN